MRNKYYYGKKISDYGLERGFVDLNTFSEVMGGVMHCSILQKITDLELEWEIVNGSLYEYFDTDGNVYSYDEAQDKINCIQSKIDELQEEIENIDDEDNEDIESLEQAIKNLEEEINTLEEPEEKTLYRYYIISAEAAETLMQDSEEELLMYCKEMDIYVWCMTKHGENWNNILTDIPVKFEC